MTRFVLLGRGCMFAALVLFLAMLVVGCNNYTPSPGTNPAPQVTNIPAPPAVPTVPAPLPPKPVEKPLPPPDLGPSGRDIAIWVLKMGGWCEVVVDGQTVQIRKAADVPGKEFVAAGVIRIDISQATLIDSDKASLKDCTGLRCLWASGSTLSTDSLSQCAGLNSLEELNICRTKVRDFPLNVLGRLERLRILYAGGTGVGDEMMSVLGTLPNIEDLDLSYTQVSDRGVVALGSCSRLRVLNLSGSHVSAKAIPSLAALAQLRRLLLVDLPLTDDDIQPLRTLTKLEHLNLCNTKVTAPGIASVKRALPRCEVLR